MSEFKNQPEPVVIDESLSRKFVDLEDLMAFEDGRLDEEETVNLFQRLVDSGLAWQLQGSYGRFAHALILAGKIHPPAFS